MIKRRTALLVHRDFQIRFALFVCSWLFLLSLVYPLIVYKLFQFFVRYADVELMLVSGLSLGSLQMRVIWIVLALQGTFLLLTFVMSLFTSHRIAGPLHQLRMALQEAKEGRSLPELHFRKGDHFKELEEDFNEWIHRVRAKVDLNQDTLDQAIHTLDELCKSGKAQASDLDETLTDLRRLRDRMTI